MKQPIFTEKAPKPIGPYNQAVKAGNFFFVSGQLAIDPKQGKIVADTITLQTKQVMENIRRHLASCRLQFKRLSSNHCLPFIFILV